MVTYRTNRGSGAAAGSPLARPAATADECFRAMERHAHGNTPPTPAAAIPAPPAARPPSAPGDIIYGAKAIAGYVFGDEGSRARRRVFNLWTYYRDREEKAGFFKLKGALCLSKSQWQNFHGLD